MEVVFVNGGGITDPAVEGAFVMLFPQGKAFAELHALNEEGGVL